MANEKHVDIIMSGTRAWNMWRMDNPNITPDLSHADLCEIDLGGDEWGFGRINLWGANLTGADLSGANLHQAILTRAGLFSANLHYADLSEADLSMANLSQAILLNSSLNGCELLATDLTDACLIEADLQRANLQLTMCQRSDLSAANLTYARLVATNLTEAILDDAIVYGSAVWDVNLNGTRQRRLLISKHDEPTITVDDLEVAQFLYLLLDRRKFRNVIDTITSKVVLILGRFTPERKAVLDAIANELRKHNFVPVIFDFERSTGRDFTETVRTLVGLSLFVIVDITNPKSSPLELQATVPDYQVPFVPIIQKGEDPFSMFRDLSGKYDWVLNPLIYANTDNLIHGFRKAIIDRAWKKHQQLQKRKAEGVEALSIDEYLRG